MKEKVKIMLAVVLLAVMVIGLPYLYSIQQADTTNEVAENTVIETEKPVKEVKSIDSERLMQAVRIVKTAEMPLYSVGQRVTNKKYVAGLYGKTVNEAAVEVAVKTDMPVESVVAQVINPETNEVVYEGAIGVAYGKSGDNDTYYISFNRYVFKDPEVWGENVKPDERLCTYPVKIILQSGYDSSVQIFAN